MDKEIRKQTALFLSDQLGEFPIHFYILSNLTVTLVKQMMFILFLLSSVIYYVLVTEANKIQG